MNCALPPEVISANRNSNSRPCQLSWSQKHDNYRPMKTVLATFCLSVLAVSFAAPVHAQTVDLSPEELISMLEEVYLTEQQPIRTRDSLMAVHGVESEEAQVYQEIYEKNHAVNEGRIRALLDAHGWPSKAVIGERGNRTISNVLQHSTNDVRIKYLPMMREAVERGDLQPRFLARAEDRIATEQGKLQIYGGQMKYYPESRSFNVWPVYDPANIDERRAAIGLGPIAEHLKTRFDFEWNLEEQLERTKEFELQLQSDQ